MEGEVDRFRRRDRVPVPRVQSLAEFNTPPEAADRKARIAVRGARYSVPAACAGQTVDVCLGGGTVTALLGAGCSPATSAARTPPSR